MTEPKDQRHQDEHPADKTLGADWKQPLVVEPHSRVLVVALVQLAGTQLSALEKSLRTAAR